jgi:hypothetical protein
MSRKIIESTNYLILPSKNKKKTIKSYKTSICYAFAVLQNAVKNDNLMLRDAVNTRLITAT